MNAVFEPIRRSHHFAYRRRDAEGTRAFCKDLPGLPPTHLTLKVDSVEELERARERLIAIGVEVVGITNHHIVKPIYFFDPNGIRFELATGVNFKVSKKESDAAHELLNAWSAEKAALKALAVTAA